MDFIFLSFALPCASLLFLGVSIFWSQLSSCGCLFYIERGIGRILVLLSPILLQSCGLDPDPTNLYSYI